jgi:hypothetical protein
VEEGKLQGIGRLTVVAEGTRKGEKKEGCQAKADEREKMKIKMKMREGVSSR